jgi:predicted  nucleic acid-binding Zn-ribbon protein
MPDPTDESHAEERIAALEARVAALGSQVEQLADERRHLLLDVNVKDAYITELRLQVAEAEADLDDVRQRAALTKWNHDAALNEAMLGLNQLKAELAEAQADAARHRERAAELDLVHHRLAGKANELLHRVPAAHRAAKAAFDRINARRTRPTP